MEVARPQLRVWLQSEASLGLFFLADVCGMLQGIANRSGDRLGLPDGWADRTNPDRDRRATLNAEPTADLQGELGVHRAQWVPPDSLGRIETLKVTVELLRTVEQRESAASYEQIVRTYNYPLRQCTHHPSGKVAPLGDVLAGAG